MIDAVRTMLVMVELELRRIRHDRFELYTRSVQSVLWLVVFGTVMSSVRAMPTGDVKYIDFITPGIMIQATTFTAVFYGLTLVWERESGILKKLLTSPSPRYAIVAGRAAAGGVRGCIQLIIVVPVALLIGVKIIPNAFFFLLAVLAIFLSAVGFACVSILMASFVKSREGFMGIGQAMILPFFFASNALYPVSIMPGILREVSSLNPMSYSVDAARSLIITGDVAGVPLDFLVIIFFDIIVFLLAQANFEKIIE